MPEPAVFVTAGPVGMAVQPTLPGVHDTLVVGSMPAGAAGSSEQLSACSDPRIDNANRLCARRISTSVPPKCSRRAPLFNHTTRAVRQHQIDRDNISPIDRNGKSASSSYERLTMDPSLRLVHLSPLTWTAWRHALCHAVLDVHHCMTHPGVCRCGEHAMAHSSAFSRCEVVDCCKRICVDVARSLSRSNGRRTSFTIYEAISRARSIESRTTRAGMQTRRLRHAETVSAKPSEMRYRRARHVLTRPPASLQPAG